MKTVVLILLISQTSAAMFVEDSGNFFGKIKSGLQMAGQFFGFDVSNGVAQLVSQTFGQESSKKGEDNEKGNNIFSGFMRLLGLESGKLGAVAVNAVIFIAKLISTTLSGPTLPELTKARTVREGTPLEWILNSPNSKMADMINRAKNEDLIHHVIEYIKERSSDEETGCLQLLVCNLSPFVRKMQKALSKDKQSEGVDQGKNALFRYLPSLGDIKKQNEECKEKIPYCVMTN